MRERAAGRRQRLTRRAEGPDDAVTGQITLTSGGSTEPSPGPPTVASNTGYSLLNVPTAHGTFAVHLIKEQLSDVRVKTVAGAVRRREQRVRGDERDIPLSP